MLTKASCLHEGWIAPVGREVLGVRAIRRYGYYLNYGALRPLMDMVSLSGDGLRRRVVGFSFCAVLVVRKRVSSVLCKHGCCSCSGTSLMFLAPKRSVGVGGDGTLPSRK